MKARMQHLDSRVAAAEELAATAEAEVARSQERREHAQETVIVPMNTASAHNQFAAIIRKGLANGPPVR